MCPLKALCYILPLETRVCFQTCVLELLCGGQKPVTPLIFFHPQLTDSSLSSRIGYNYAPPPVLWPFLFYHGFWSENWWYLVANCHVSISEHHQGERNSVWGKKGLNHAPRAYHTEPLEFQISCILSRSVSSTHCIRHTYAWYSLIQNLHLAEQLMLYLPILCRRLRTMGVFM